MLDSCVSNAIVHSAIQQQGFQASVRRGESKDKEREAEQVKARVILDLLLRKFETWYLEKMETNFFFVVIGIYPIAHIDDHTQGLTFNCRL